MADPHVPARDLSRSELDDEASRLLATLPPGAVIWLSGDLGTGKTTFVQSVVKAAGGAEPARSPTFALLHQYRSAAGTICHADCYRLKEPREVFDLDLDALARTSRLLLIEWPERARGALPQPDAHLRFSHVADPDRRRVERAR